MVSQESTRIPCSSSRRSSGCKNQGKSPGDVSRRAPNKAHPLQVNKLAKMVSYETHRLSTTSWCVPGCKNQGNPTPGGVERRAPNKVRLFQVNKSYKICAVTLLIMALSVTPVLGMNEDQEETALKALLRENDTPSTEDFRGYLQKDDAKHTKKKELIKLLKEWQTTTDIGKQIEVENWSKKPIDYIAKMASVYCLQKYLSEVEMPETYHTFDDNDGHDAIVILLRKMSIQSVSEGPRRSRKDSIHKLDQKIKEITAESERPTLGDDHSNTSVASILSNRSIKDMVNEHDADTIEHFGEDIIADIIKR